jgi:hypothetical protein
VLVIVSQHLLLEGQGEPRRPGGRLTYHGAMSHALSNNSSPLNTSDASTTQLRQVKCQVVLLLSGGLETENRKVGGSTPPLATLLNSGSDYLW